MEGSPIAGSLFHIVNQRAATTLRGDTLEKELRQKRGINVECGH